MILDKHIIFSIRMFHIVNVVLGFNFGLFEKYLFIISEYELILFILFGEVFILSELIRINGFLLIVNVF